MESHQDEVVQLLKPVFDSCDFNGDGYVKIQDLLVLGKKHAFENIDELVPILQQLDPEGHGRVTFQDFCQRVKEITTGDNHKSTGSPIPFEQRPRSYTDSEGFFEDPDSPSHSTTSTNDYYGDLDDFVSSAHDSHHENNNKKGTKTIYSTYPLNGMHKHKKKHPSIFLNNQLLGRTSEHQSKEEGFEAFGEASDGDETASLHSDYSTPDRDHQRFNRRISGSSAARRLRMVQSAHCSLHNSIEELHPQINIDAYSDNEYNMMNLADKIESLSTQVSSLQIDQAGHQEKAKKSKEDNKKLLERIVILEEHLHEAKAETSSRVEEETAKYKASLLKLQRDHTNNIDQIQLDLKRAEHQIEELKATEPMLRKELELCLEDRRFAQQKIDELNDGILERDARIAEMRHRIRQKNEDIERMKNDRLQEIAELTEELESLRPLRNEATAQYDEKNELIKEINRLKMENDKLKNSKDDLRDQLLQHKTFFDAKKKESLADELLTADKEEVLKVLKSQELDNHRMRQYIDMLLMLIMESDPTLLEKC